FSQQGDDAPLMSNIGVKEISRADFLTATGVSHSKILSVKTEMLKSNPLIDRAPLRAAYSERES
ncbi:MAG: hypothetical protein WCI62_02695, partial [Erysipelotrichaceae bacterium]